MKATININYTQAFTSNNLKGKSFKVVETVGNRTTLSINGRLTDFYNNEVTILETREIKNVKMSHHNNMGDYFIMNVIVRADNKIKLLFDTFGEWKQCFQTVKTTNKGEYMTLYGNRVYFWGVTPEFK